MADSASNFKPSTPTTILIVDDSEIVLELAKDTLESAGYRVITHGRPSGSVAAIIREKPNVILLDVNMPVVAGDTIAKILQKIVDRSTLVLLHSSLPVEVLREKVRETGAHGYIAKTGNKRELLRNLEYWLHQSSYRTSGIMPVPLSSNATPVATSVEPSPDTKRDRRL